MKQPTLARSTYSKLLANAAVQLRKAGCETPELDARLLMQSAGETDRAGLLLLENEECSPQISELFNSHIARRIAREPVFRILGKREFHGMVFKLGRETLEPRDDSECLIDAVLEQIEDRNGPYNFLDLGTGTGVIALTLLSELPRAIATATDISRQALTVAQDNAFGSGFAGRLSVIESHWLSKLDGSYDFIVSNPPYIDREMIGRLAPEVLNHDPAIALDGGEGGLDAYRQIFQTAAPFMKPQGFMALEIGFDQLLSVTDLGKSFGWIRVSQHNDLSGQTRAVVFIK